MKAWRWAAASSVLLAACQAGSHLRTPRPQGPAQAASPRPSASPSPVGGDAASSGAPLPSTAPAPRLEAQAYLSGRVQVDASYLVAKGLGQLVGAGAGAIQVTGLLANNSAGGLSPQAAAGLVANHGGGLISNHGGALLSDASGGLLSNHGAGAVGADAFRLLQSGAPALGQQLPAAGMALRAFDLQSGQALPLVGADGQALGAVLSGADGSYRLALGAKAQGRVLLTAEVPGQADPRAALRTLAMPQAEAASSPTQSLDIERLRVAVDNVTHAVGQALLLPERGGKAAAVARIQAGCKALGVAPEAAASADAAASL